LGAELVKGTRNGMSMVKQRYQWLIDGVACDKRTIRTNLRDEYIWVGR